MKRIAAAITGAIAAAMMLGGCASLLDWDNTPERRSQSELDKDALEGCEDTPNTDEMMKCRRRVQDSWRDGQTPGPLGRVSFTK